MSIYRKSVLFVQLILLTDDILIALWRIYVAMLLFSLVASIKRIIAHKFSTQCMKIYYAKHNTYLEYTRGEYEYEYVCANHSITRSDNGEEKYE